MIYVFTFIGEFGYELFLRDGSKGNQLYEKIMEACGGYGELVEDPLGLEGAMLRGLAKVRGGTPALLNVITSAGGRD